MSRTKKIARNILILGSVLLAADQVVLYTALEDGRFNNAAVAPYFPPQFRTNGAEEVPLADDPDLGWIPAEPERTLQGGRSGHPPLQSRKRPEVTRVLLLGSSVAYGAGVLPEETFAAQLDASSATLEIINLAVPYYGPDQIHLYRERLSDFGADEIWFAFEPRTARYAMTGYVPLARRDMKIDRFKPQVVCDDEDWSVIPRASRAVLSDRDQWEDFLERDGLAGVANSGRRAFGVPGFGEKFATTRLLATWIQARRFQGGAVLQEPEHSNYRTVMQILLRADREASNRGIRFRVLALPHRADYAELGWRSFTDDLRSHGVELLDLTGTLGVEGGAGNDQLWTDSGLWSASAHAIAAAELALLFQHELSR